MSSGSRSQRSRVLVVSSETVTSVLPGSPDIHGQTPTIPSLEVENEPERSVKSTREVGGSLEGSRALNQQFKLHGVYSEKAASEAASCAPRFFRMIKQVVVLALTGSAHGLQVLAVRRKMKSFCPVGTWAGNPSTWDCGGCPVPILPFSGNMPLFLWTTMVSHFQALWFRGGWFCSLAPKVASSEPIPRTSANNIVKSPLSPQRWGSREGKSRIPVFAAAGRSSRFGWAEREREVILGPGRREPCRGGFLVRRTEVKSTRLTEARPGGAEWGDPQVGAR